VGVVLVFVGVEVRVFQGVVADLVLLHLLVREMNIYFFSYCLSLFRPGDSRFSGFWPHALWTYITFLIGKFKLPNLVTLPKICLETTWSSKFGYIKFDVTMTTTCQQAGFYSGF